MPSKDFKAGSDKPKGGNLQPLDNMISIFKEHIEKHPKQSCSARLNMFVQNVAESQTCDSSKTISVSTDSTIPNSSTATPVIPTAKSKFSFGKTNSNTTTPAISFGASDSSKKSLLSSAAPFTTFSFVSSADKSKSSSGPPEFSFGKPTAPPVPEPNTQSKAGDDDGFPVEEKEKIEREKILMKTFYLSAVRSFITTKIIPGKKATKELVVL